MRINHTMIQQAQQDMLALGNALGSGNQAAAQTNVSSFQQDFSSLIQSLGQSTNNSVNVNQTMTSAQSDLSTLSQDVNSGNLTAAQSELAKFRGDFRQAMQSYRQSRLSSNLNNYMAGAGNLAQNTAALLPGSTTGALLNVSA